MRAFVLLCGLLFASDAVAQCVTCVPMPAAPQIIYQPQVRYVPAYQLQGVSVGYQPRVYPTPFRNWLFGRGSWNYSYQYAPIQQQPARKPEYQGQQ